MSRSECPLVSVIIPTCNRRALIERCLEALTRQTHPHFEVIVIDDHSTDTTSDFLSTFAVKHPGFALRTLRNDRNLGANPSRNRGIRESRGAFVAFLDSDCIAEPDWLERLVRGFSSDRVAAVTGRVDDPPPGNIFELTLKGTHRVHGSGSANRLVAGNMCVRRDPLLRFMLDEDRASPISGEPDLSVSGRGDEEGLFLSLRAAGYQQRVVPDAIVYHDHHYSARSFFKQAFRGGGSAARLVYKYHLPPRLDLLPFILAYVTIPLAAWHEWLAAVPACFFVAALLAITYNDIRRKGKTVVETMKSFPTLIVYYHLRLCGYALETARLWTGLRRIPRVATNKD